MCTIFVVLVDTEVVELSYGVASVARVLSGSYVVADSVWTEKTEVIKQLCISLSVQGGLD